MIPSIVIIIVVTPGKINRNNLIFFSKILLYRVSIFFNPFLITISDNDDEIFLPVFKNIFESLEHLNIFFGKSALLFNVEYIVERYLTHRKIISYFFDSFLMRNTTIR